MMISVGSGVGLVLPGQSILPKRTLHNAPFYYFRIFTQMTHCYSIKTHISLVYYFHNNHGHPIFERMSRAEDSCQ